MQKLTLAVSEDLTHDAFLGGKLHLWQPRRGYRAGVDPVLLAACIPAKAGQTVLELGCGVGAASLCLAARVPGVSLIGVELQENYAALARRNAADLACDMTVITADLRALPADIRQVQADHVIMNPPYFDRATGTAADNHGRDVAFAGRTPLSDWLSVGISRLRPKGLLTIIQRINRLPETLAGLDSRVGSVVVQPIAARNATPPHLFIAQCKHSGRAPFRMCAPLVMHLGDAHDGDRDSYTPAINDVLRIGAALSFCD